MKTIRDELARKLKSIGIAQGLPVGYENVSFNPNGKAHLAEQYSVTSRALQGIGSGREYGGFYSVGVHYPAGSKPEKAMATADAIVTAYTEMGIARFDGGYVRVTNVRPLQAIQGDTWYIIPVEINWTGYTRRNE